MNTASAVKFVEDRLDEVRSVIPAGWEVKAAAGVCMDCGMPVVSLVFTYYDGKRSAMVDVAHSEDNLFFGDMEAQWQSFKSVALETITLRMTNPPKTQGMPLIMVMTPDGMKLIRIGIEEIGE